MSTQDPNVAPPHKAPGTGKPPETPSNAERAHTEELLDEALTESFPASDPVSISAER